MQTFRTLQQTTKNTLNDTFKDINNINVVSFNSVYIFPSSQRLLFKIFIFNVIRIFL